MDRRTKRKIAAVFTAVTTVMAINVTRKGVQDGTGLIPGLSFLIYAIIGLGYTYSERLEAAYGLLVQTLASPVNRQITKAVDASSATVHRLTAPALKGIDNRRTRFQGSLKQRVHTMRESIELTQEELEKQNQS